MDNFGTLIRVSVSIGIGFLAMCLTRLGFKEMSGQVDTLVLILTPMVYSAAVKWLETKHPSWGYLLGVKKSQSNDEETDSTPKATS